MGRLWKRKMIVEFPDLTRDGKPLSYEYPPWGMMFKIKFDMYPDANTAEVILYNISRETIASIKRGMPVKLYAGYEDDEVGLVFAGSVDQLETRYDGVDKAVRLVVTDGRDSVLKDRPNKTWPAGTPCAQVASDLFQMAGLKVGAVVVDGTATYDKAVNFSANYTVATALDQVVRDVELKTGKKHTWYVDLGYGYLVPRLWNGVGKKLKVDAYHGLIHTPEPLDKLTSDLAGTQAEPLQWRVRMAFNWRVGPGWQVEVDSRRLKGLLKVVSGEHICTPTEKFETDLICDQIQVTFVEFDYFYGDERTRMPVTGAGEAGEGEQ